MYGIFLFGSLRRIVIEKYRSYFCSPLIKHRWESVNPRTERHLKVARNNKKVTQKLESINLIFKGFLVLFELLTQRNLHRIELQRLTLHIIWHVLRRLSLYFLQALRYISSTSIVACIEICIMYCWARHVPGTEALYLDTPAMQLLPLVRPARIPSKLTVARIRIANLIVPCYIEILSSYKLGHCPRRSISRLIGMPLWGNFVSIVKRIASIW